MNLFDVYSLYDIEPVRGEGCKVFTADGSEYLDLYGGHAVISVGHAHPRYVEAISGQVAKLGFYSNSVQNSLQSQLASLLGKASGYDDYSLFLCNSGAEANENAMKLASFATGRPRILAFDKAFHGRTFGAVAVTDNPKIRAPFNSTDHVAFVPLNDIQAVESELAKGDVAAVIIEGIQGVAGIRMVADDFLHQLRDACDKHGSLLILDEIQSGYGRTGKFFAHQHAGVKADIVTCAKGIANGFPMGAVIISPALKAEKGMLGTTFGGNHLACAAAIAVLQIMRDEGLVDNAAAVGQHLIDGLKALTAKYPQIKEVRGRGLMIGFEIEGSAADMRRSLLFEKHVFTGGAGLHTVRLLPALCISEAEADAALMAIEAVLADYSNNN
ncbi:MAG: aminotransferase class III-fold pyridoxal phosphate-dependent enzyme [Clostridium sp.]|nr:aminotransferase class III-fold pyridoxal phosphate-dependent enzyme [Clostridium sp.]